VARYAIRDWGGGITTGTKPHSVRDRVAGAMGATIRISRSLDSEWNTSLLTKRLLRHLTDDGKKTVQIFE